METQSYEATAPERRHAGRAVHLNPRMNRNHPTRADLVPFPAEPGAVPLAAHPVPIHHPPAPPPAAAPMHRPERAAVAFAFRSPFCQAVVLAA